MQNYATGRKPGDIFGPEDCVQYPKSGPEVPKNHLNTCLLVFDDDCEDFSGFSEVVYLLRSDGEAVGPGRVY